MGLVKLNIKRIVKAMIGEGNIDEKIAVDSTFFDKRRQIFLLSLSKKVHWRDASIICQA